MVCIAKLPRASIPIQNWFEEILEDICAPSLESIEVYVSVIKPKLCNQFIDELKRITPLDKDKRWPQLRHLRRVRRVLEDSCINYSENNLDDINHRFKNDTKKKSRNFQLEVLLGSVLQIENLQYIPHSREFKDFYRLLLDYKIHLKRIYIPLTCYKSHSWPMNYHANQSFECNEKHFQLTPNELKSMRLHMFHAKKDSDAWASISCDVSGVVIIDPSTDQIVSSSFAEGMKQRLELHDFNGKVPFYPTDMNPLCTSIILSIQGISRFQRKVGLKPNLRNDMQYICTGYDVYMTEEPNIYESMALLHSRARRVIFGNFNKIEGGLGSIGKKMAVHLLKGTNHCFRVFHWNEAF